MHLQPILSTILLCGGLVACTVGPDYQPPSNENLDLPNEFGELDDPAFKAGKADLRTWWTVFEDPMLTELIEQAATDNRDLRIAMSRVTEARARNGIAESYGAPQVGVGAGVEAARDASTGYETRARSSVGLGASWELDVFGRISREVEASVAEYQATEEDRRDVQVSLFAEVARAYLSVRALQGQLQAAQDNIEAQSETLELTRIRLENGLATALDHAQAKQVLATSISDVPPLRIALSQEINTIAVLVGTHPQELHTDLATPQPIPVPPQTVTINVPAEILRQRPDVRAAERRLAAQSAEVGVATADLYPSFSINGNLGFSSIGSGNLFDASSQGFALGPSFQWNLFNGGRVRAEIDVQNARLEQSLLLYESVILSALGEIESAMVAFTEQRVRLDAVEEAAEESRTTLRLATQLYKDGLADFQQVLDAQRQTLFTESDVVTARGLASQNLVSLYKALGGGWDPSEVEAFDDGTGDAPSE